MIAFVEGAVDRVGLDRAVVVVGGVGLLVHTTPATAAGLRSGQPARLATSLVVREDSLTLFGFATEPERELFELVQTVSGVGPRLALAMLSVHTPEALRAALGSGDVTALTKVPGVGKKGAERLILELRDRIGPSQDTSPLGDHRPSAIADWRTQVSQALVGLGWGARQADAAVESVAAELGDDPPVAFALRAALRELGR
ncbi:MAG TPA: Holliday junction branch migration protein RuvA [Dermatophilaceae bacterium]|nr:Holliday junction branch migration protein RuvA [Dermatophilaceae bacterium]